jgi:hypothetical protein
MLRVLETAWLLIVLMGLSLGTFKLVTETMASALWFYLFTSVAVVFWIIRRKQRIRAEKRQSKV